MKPNRAENLIGCYQEKCYRTVNGVLFFFFFIEWSCELKENIIICVSCPNCWITHHPTMKLSREPCIQNIMKTATQMREKKNLKANQKTTTTSISILQKTNERKKNREVGTCFRLILSGINRIGRDIWLGELGCYPRLMTGPGQMSMRKCNTFLGAFSKFHNGTNQSYCIHSSL